MKRYQRRHFLKIGTLGAGLSLSQFLRLRATAGESSQKRYGRSAILVFLKGGPSHLDTFDMKPDAPAEYRGEFRPIKTSVPGLEICEHLPLLAKCAHRYALVRGISHNLAAHNLGTEYLLTGNRPSPLVKHPVFGSVVSKELPAPPDVPPFVAIDREPGGPGYLGVRYGPLNTGEKPHPNRPFNVRGVTFDDGLGITNLVRRHALAKDLDTAFSGLERYDDQVAALDQFSQQAYQIITSARTREAFDLSNEAEKTLARYGEHETGRSLLLASRLIEAGVRFVTVVVDGWDTHQGNFTSLKRQLLPRLDQGLSALYQNLESKGMLESTAVLVTGEFGRTPKVNGNAGRDHWPRAMFSLMAGGNVLGGHVAGASDAKGEEPNGDGFTPDDVAASFYHNIGISPSTEYATNTGRPIQLVRDGKVISRIFSG